MSIYVSRVFDRRQFDIRCDEVQRYVDIVETSDGFTAMRVRHIIEEYDVQGILPGFEPDFVTRDGFYARIDWDTSLDVPMFCIETYGGVPA